MNGNIERKCLGTKDLSLKENTMKATTYNGWSARTSLSVNDGIFEISFRITDGKYTNMDRRSFPVTGILMEDVLDKFEGMRAKNALAKEANIVKFGDKVRRATFPVGDGLFSVAYFEGGKVLDRTKKNAKGRRFFQSPVELIGGKLHAEVTRDFRKNLRNIEIEVREPKAKAEAKPSFAG